MTEIINLRRARKIKARAAKDKTAQANRVQHGTPKAVRNLAQAREDLAGRNLENRRLDHDMKDK